LGALSAPPLAASFSHPAIRTALFPVPEQLEANVGFWRSIYGQYPSHQVVIHDERYLDVVYEVVELGDLDAAGISDATRARGRRSRVRAAEEKTRAVLRELARNPELDTRDARRIRHALRTVGDQSRDFRDASWRVRSQTGLRDRFAEAVRVSGRFVPHITAILREHGVPVEVVVMPFVESMFNHRARSKVGASGAWQFTYATGKIYLDIDAAVDERSDVLLAARGAARKLRDDYDRLETWPLALTAYNHGTAGMGRAVQQLGTRDIGVIAERYRSRSFGFASRNFYAEFLAALIVYHDREELFPGVEPDPPLDFEEFPPSRFVAAAELARRARVELEVLEELNPALSRDVWTGTLLVPRDYPLRVPRGSLVDFQQAWAELPAEVKSERQSVSGYRVRRGDTLGAIAATYGTSVSAIQQANGLARADLIHPGQDLIIPQGRSGRSRPAHSTQRVVGAPREEAIYVVQRGDTLARIAVRYGATEGELVAANRLRSADLIHPGQRIRVPGIAAAAGNAHVVRRGETLFRIALLYSTSVDAIVSTNGLRSTLIQIGQVLLIPGD
jgi:membrane-bound lytic murein transglycosylase D